MIIDEALKIGIEAHNSSNFREADRYYTAIIKAVPNHPEANYKLGILALQMGELDAAISFFRTAVDNNLENEKFWLSFIDAMIKSGKKYSTFISDAKEAIQDEARRQKFDHGIKILIHDDNRNPPSKIIETIVSGFARESLEVNKEVILGKLKNYPKSDQLFFLLAEICAALNDKLEAVGHYSHVIFLNPKNRDAYNNIGLLLHDLGELGLAKHYFSKAISVDAQFFVSHHNLADLYVKLGDFRSAISHYKIAISIEPRHRESYLNLSNVYYQLGQSKDALEYINEAIRADESFAGSYHNKGNILLATGRFADAEVQFRTAIKLSPVAVSSHFALSNLISYTLDDPHLLTMEDLEKRNVISNADKCYLFSGLAKAYEDCGFISKSFAYYKKSNDNRKSYLRYDIERDKTIFGRVHHTLGEFAKFSKWSSSKSFQCSPIFIIGMPRSGTTLLEQLLSNHSEVAGAGELELAGMFGGNLSLGQEIINSDTLEEFRASYLTKISDIAGQYLYVIDKMPQNFLFVPLLCTALPEAKIIHITRDARAACWSNYKHLFSSDSLGYTFDLTDTVTYFTMYYDWMQQVNSVFGDRIINIRYEDLIKEPELTLRKVCNDIMLGWEENCLNYLGNSKQIKTASAIQVRKGIYSGSNKGWKKFEPFLANAFARLPYTE